MQLTLESEKFLKIINFLGEQSSYPNEISRKLGMSSSQAQKWLLWLFRKRMVIRKKGSLRRVFYSLNTKSQLLKTYRRILFSEKLVSSKHWKRLCQLMPCGIYGSFSEGMWDERSDLDVWIYVTSPKHRIEARKISNGLSEEFKKTVNLTFLDRSYLKNLKDKDPEFFYRLKLQSMTTFPEVFNVA